MAVDVLDRLSVTPVLGATVTEVSSKNIVLIIFVINLT